MALTAVTGLTAVGGDDMMREIVQSVPAPQTLPRTPITQPLPPPPPGRPGRGQPPQVVVPQQVSGALPALLPRVSASDFTA